MSMRVRFEVLKQNPGNKRALIHITRDSKDGEILITTYYAQDVEKLQEWLEEEQAEHESIKEEEPI